MHILFLPRKVRMAREYYVEAITPDGTKHRIGSFKLRARAQAWIDEHSAKWDPGQADGELPPNDD